MQSVPPMCNRRIITIQLQFEHYDAAVLGDTCAMHYGLMSVCFIRLQARRRKVVKQNCCNFFHNRSKLTIAPIVLFKLLNVRYYSV